MSTIAVTGANGYVGGLISAALKADGHEVIALSRRPTEGLPHRRFALGTPPDPSLFDGVDGLVHAAYDLRLRTWAEIEAINIRGSASLLGAATKAGVPHLLHISSMSAYAGTRQDYGRAKLAIEEQFTRAGGCSARLGLVYGPDGGGMIGSLRKLADLPLVPVFRGDHHQYTVQATQVGPVVARAIAAGQQGIMSVAHPDPVDIREILSALRTTPAKSRFVPIPWRPVYRVMRLAEAGHVPLPLRADSVLGLVEAAPALGGQVRVADLGVSLRPFGWPVPVGESSVVPT